MQQRRGSTKGSPPDWTQGQRALHTQRQNPYQLRDLDNQSMVCFVFTDISIRQEGNFRFKFTLYEIVA